MNVSAGIKREIAGVLFDCDGVLADSEAQWDEIDALHLEHFGVANYDGSLKPHVLGRSFELSIGFYREHFGIEASLDRMIEHRTLVAREFYARRIELFEGARESLAQARGAGLRIAMATSSRWPLIEPFLNRHGLTEAFDAIVTGERVTWGKPFPDIYLLAAREIGVEARSCLVVEDALSGLRAGRDAGCFTVGIPDARWLDPRLFEGQADFLLGSIGELSALIRQEFEIAEPALLGRDPG